MSAPPLPPPAVDLATLLGEMAALKSEVRAETRASRAQREALEGAAGALEQELARARQREERLRAELEEARERAQREEISRLLTLHDRLVALERGARDAPARGLWPWRRVDPALASLAEGLSLLLGRIEDGLAGLGVARIATAGLPLDPHRMEALGAAEDATRPRHEVIEEIASGWERGDHVLRAAKVVVSAGPKGTPQ